MGREAVGACVVVDAGDATPVAWRAMDRRHCLIALAVALAPAACSSSSVPGETGGASVDTVAAESIVISQVTLLVTETDLTLARAADVAVDARGSIYVLDHQDRRVVVLDGEGRLERTIGGPGEGPGELGARPIDLGIVGDELFVYDLRRRTVDQFGVDGTFIRQYSIVTYPVPGYAVSFGADRLALASGGVLPGGGLATVVGLDGSEPQEIGEPVASWGQAEWEAFTDDAGRGVMPQPLRNAVHVVLSGDGGLWLFLQTERELRRYDAEGVLRSSVPIALDVGDAIEEAYFDWYADPKNQIALRFLALVVDGIEIDGRLWLLWGSWEGMEGLITVHDGSGELLHRIRFPALYEAGAPVAPRRFAVDPAAGRVYVVAPSASSLWALELPEGVGS